MSESENYLQRLRKIRQKYGCPATSSLFNCPDYREAQSINDDRSPQRKKIIQSAQLPMNVAAGDPLQHRLNRIKEIQNIKKNYGPHASKHVRFADQNLPPSRGLSAPRQVSNKITATQQMSDYIRQGFRGNPNSVNVTPSRHEATKLEGAIGYSQGFGQISRAHLKNRQNLIYQTPSKRDVPDLQKTVRVGRSDGINYRQNYTTFDQPLISNSKKATDFKFDYRHNTASSPRKFHENPLSEFRNRMGFSGSRKKDQAQSVQTTRHNNLGLNRTMGGGQGKWSMDNFNRIQMKIQSILHQKY